MVAQAPTAYVRSVKVRTRATHSLPPPVTRRKQNRYGPWTQYGSWPLFRLKHWSGIFIKHCTTRDLGRRARPPGSVGGMIASSQQHSEH